MITLGAEAFEWFKPYADVAAFHTDGRSETRFETLFRCQLPGCNQTGFRHEKTVVVYPLPHPSPLNRRWFSRFPVDARGPASRGLGLGDLVIAGQPCRLRDWRYIFSKSVFSPEFGTLENSGFLRHGRCQSASRG